VYLFVKDFKHVKFSPDLGLFPSLALVHWNFWLLEEKIIPF